MFTSIGRQAKGLSADFIAAATAVLATVQAGELCAQELTGIPPPDGVDPTLWILIMGVLTGLIRLGMWVAKRWLDSRKGNRK